MASVPLIPEILFQNKRGKWLVVVMDDVSVCTWWLLDCPCLRRTWWRTNPAPRTRTLSPSWWWSTAEHWRGTDLCNDPVTWHTSEPITSQHCHAMSWSNTALNTSTLTGPQAVSISYLLKVLSGPAAPTIFKSLLRCSLALIALHHHPLTAC